MIIPVGAAEAAVSKHRIRLDLAASWGVPAHVTVVFPFLPPSEVDHDVVSRLAGVFAAASTFVCSFETCEWFGDDVLWLAPDRDQQFRDLTVRVVSEFPDYPPYGGQFDDVVPHLTVGESQYGTVAELRAAAADVSSQLPIAARIDHALLVAGTDRPGTWHTLARLPLGAASRASVVRSDCG
ncbi:2'-5' RNA ligase family protein [Nocardioides conyzicola]|uniref:2'-5' RNA ligase family protein n=1 Tax=Nocardioides conyzicola TaxID=1651781 RepID=UPI0031ECFC9D